MKKQAIISVYNKDGLEPFAKGLDKLGYEILSTGGTAKYLSEQGIGITKIGEYTGHPEILDGRVKSLHPKIHGGILARMDLEKDKADLEKNEISPIGIVSVNLYPFIDKIKEAQAKGLGGEESLVEFIDIGGPTMIRAAAKNWRFVVPICDPSDYPSVLEELERDGDVSVKTRQRLAAKVYLTMSAYDGQIARYFSESEEIFNQDGSLKELGEFEALALKKKTDLRYGENPHQSAALYSQFTAGSEANAELWQKLAGKEISYNNLLDMQGALELFLEIYQNLEDKHAAVIIKHSNPCGVAIRDNALDAFKAARDCDALSAFGGIIALSGTLDKALADSIIEGFVEVILFSEITDEALEVFKKKKNIRLIKSNFDALLENYKSGGLSIRRFYNDYLVQTIDSEMARLLPEQVVTEVKPSEEMLADLQFAWRLCKYVKSNTIVIVKDQTAIGIGAGQMSRVDAAELAIKRAKAHGHDIQGAVAASDAFLPFSDTLEVLTNAGVKALAQPGGSIKDQDVIDFANDKEAVMLFTGTRHFRH